MEKSLFERLCSIEHLQSAWGDVKAKKAGGGIDGANIATFEINLSSNLNMIREELATGQWKPQPYLRACLAGSAAGATESLRQRHPRPSGW